MKLKYLLAASVVSLSAAATIATPAAAQTITSGVEGTVAGEDGTALPGATVTVTDTRTGAARTATTGSNGGFRIVALSPGGPYTVTVTAPGFEGQTVEDVFTNISGNTSFDFELSASAAGGSDNIIIVTGARAGASQVAVGPGTAFGAETLEAFPSITRDIRDIIRIDPRVSIERSGDVDRISCLGGNDRSNTFTVDGIIQSDVFGLNGTPFAARNALPLPFDVIEQTSVEFAPFDVEFSDFTGCLVNVVTKAGSNEFSGSAFITYFDDGLQADSVQQADGEDQDFNAGRELRWGATLSGPIIKDTLFFSFGYEETDLGGGFNDGPDNPTVDFFTEDQFNQFAAIAQDVYGQDVGPIPTQLDESSVRYFGRLDAQLGPDNRLVATYQRLEETNIEQDFFGGDDFSGLNSFEDEGTVSDTYSLQWYSNWNDNLSTEFRISRAEVTDVQGPVGFGEAQSDSPTVRLAVGNVGPGDNGTFNTGPGIFRSANALESQITQARFILNYDTGGDHFFKIGAELNDLEVFNLFIPNATGAIFFSNLDDFAQGLVAPGPVFDESLFGGQNDSLIEGGTFGGIGINTSSTGDPAAAAAQFSRQIYSFFAQDEWQATDQLSINAGVRVQLFDGSAPTPNDLFAQRLGFTNSVSFASIDPVVLPRFSATYEFDNDGFFSGTSVTGGVGIFTGGDPVVFFSNAFSNNGFSFAEGSSSQCDPSELNIDADTGQIDVTPDGGPFTGIPQCVIDAGVAVASTGGGNVQSTDPDFDIPTAVRFNAGLATTFGTESGFFSDWNLNLDYIYTRFNDTLAVVDLVQAVNPDLGDNGFAADGRPILRPVDTLLPGCNATFTGNNPPSYTGLSPECFLSDTADFQEFLQLTNGPSFDSHNASLILSKRFSEGVFTEGGSVNVNFGYAFSDAEQTINTRSSTAGSNFDGTAVLDPQSPGISQSGFETRHNFTVTLNFREEFFDDYATSLGIFFRASEGRPYSLTFDNFDTGDLQDAGLVQEGIGGFRGADSSEANILAFIPTGINDPALSPLSNPVAVQQFLDAINTGEGIVSELNCSFTPGQVIERNTCRNPWFFDLDFRISQEVPFIGSLTGIKDDRLELFVDVNNFFNLLGSDGNSLRSVGGFEGRVDLLEAAFDDDGLLILDNFNPNSAIGNTDEFNTAWRIQLGARYEF
ncbi:MAG: carboxypeptidase regulatory-like domain-containing protein [Pseudomonadota bacterium]